MQHNHFFPCLPLQYNVRKCSVIAPLISSILCYRPQPLLAFRPDKSSPPTVQCYAGDWVYVRGENFGMAPSETQVQIYDPNVLDPVTMMNKVTGVARVPDSCLISTGTDNCDHNLITFRMPAGSGKRQSVQVQTLGASTFYRAFANESAFNAQPVYFEYFPGSYQLTNASRSQGHQCR